MNVHVQNVGLSKQFVIALYFVHCLKMWAMKRKRTHYEWMRICKTSRCLQLVLFYISSFNHNLFGTPLELEIHSDVVNKIVVVIMIIIHAGTEKLFHINYARTSHYGVSHTHTHSSRRYNRQLLVVVHVHWMHFGWVCVVWYSAMDHNLQLTFPYEFQSFFLSDEQWQINTD